MDFIKFSISKPVTVCVGIILVILFGVIGLMKLPLQLTPDIERPEITVRTTWPGASPYEVEKDIIEEQENVLKSVTGVVSMESSSYNDYGEISLTFETGVDINSALLRVSNKLDEVVSYPENVQKPSISSASAKSSPVMWMIIKSIKGEPDRIKGFRTFFENDVRQYMERVKGVGDLFIFGGSEKQLEIVVSQEKLANYGITINQIINRIQTSNIDVSAGLQGVSQKNYRIRTVSQFQKPTDALDILLKDDGLKRVFLRDVANVRMGLAVDDVVVEHNGAPVIVIGIRKEQGANVVEMTNAMKEVILKLNDGILKDKDLHCEIVSEQTPYINTAISLVKNNIIIGGGLAICILFLFLRSISSTFTTAIAIPVSAVGTFVFMWIFHRSLNVVSLAGISFAVGMLVDNAIVVLENIDRHRNSGESAFDAAYKGTQEVWGAVLASTLTTVAVFLPIIFMKEEAGQLFKDIAIAITFAIVISMLVSVSAVPALANQLYKRFSREKKKSKDSKIDRLGNFLSNIIMYFSELSLKSKFSRIVTIGLFTIMAIVTIMLLMPKAEYLPQGNRNFIINILIPPPGYSVNKRKELCNFVFKSTAPYFKEDYKDGIPRLRSMFFVSADRITIFGASSVHETEAAGMMPLFKRIIYSIPGIFGVSTQVGVFQDNLGGGRTIDLNIAGDNMNDIIASARLLFGSISEKLKNAQIRPIPSLENTYPEANFVPNRSRLIANGMTEQTLGLYIDVIMDGRKIGEFSPENMKKVDLVLKTDDKNIETPEDVYESFVVNNLGKLIRLKDISNITYGQGMVQIDHLERKRNITLQITPSAEIPLQKAIEIIKNDVVKKLQDAGKLSGVSVLVGGNADKLYQVMNVMKWNLLFASIIIYLLMSALFENFFYPFIILFTIPLAGAGGFIGLRLVDIFVAKQGFDIVIMLGFVILIGTVVNNAILIVHQSLNNIRYGGMGGLEAISMSVQTRIRPIYMSTVTSLLGLLPLTLSTGAGSELYRGLGSVILGGLALSSLLTIYVIPALLAFFIKFETHEK